MKLSHLLPFLTLLGFQPGVSLAYWRMACSVSQTARVDPILNPGAVSGHVHKFAGGNSVDENADFDLLRSSSCSSCEVQNDTSAYWTPQLYYAHADTGEFEEVVNYGMTVYYVGRGGNASSTVPFPEGFKMITGDTRQRSYDNTTLTYLDTRPVADRHYMFRTDCVNGMRAQVNFQSCWDGENLYLDNSAHVAYLSGIDYGVCPPTHPVSIPGLFFEVLYFTNLIDQSGGGEFVFANGDPTGYGFHGDFMNGWDMDVQTDAVANCLYTDDGGVVTACPYLATSDDTNFARTCPEEATLLDEAVHGNLTGLPGCNPITYGPALASQEVCPVGESTSIDDTILYSGNDSSTASSSQSSPTSSAVSTLSIVVSSSSSPATLSSSETSNYLSSSFTDSSISFATDSSTSPVTDSSTSSATDSSTLSSVAATSTLTSASVTTLTTSTSSSTSAFTDSPVSSAVGTTSSSPASYASNQTTGGIFAEVPTNSSSITSTGVTSTGSSAVEATDTANTTPEPSTTSIQSATQAVSDIAATSSASPLSSEEGELTTTVTDTDYVTVTVTIAYNTAGHSRSVANAATTTAATASTATLTGGTNTDGSSVDAVSTLTTTLPGTTITMGGSTFSVSASTVTTIGNMFSFGGRIYTITGSTYTTFFSIDESSITTADNDPTQVTESAVGGFYTVTGGTYTTFTTDDGSGSVDDAGTSATAFSSDASSTVAAVSTITQPTSVISADGGFYTITGSTSTQPTSVLSTDGDMYTITGSTYTTYTSLEESTTEEATSTTTLFDTTTIYVTVTPTSTLTLTSQPASTANSTFTTVSSTSSSTFSSSTTTADTSLACSLYSEGCLASANSSSIITDSTGNVVTAFVTVSDILTEETTSTTQTTLTLSTATATGNGTFFRIRGREVRFTKN